MQTRKKVLARNASRDHASSRSCRQPKKVTVIGEKKVTELITSSAKKQKSGKFFPSVSHYIFSYNVVKNINKTWFNISVVKLSLQNLLIFPPVSM